MTQPSGEFGFIDWIRKQTAADPRVVVGPGDDTAFLRVNTEAGCLATTDMLLEGSCFLLEAGGRAIGKKAMAVNLSDMAAMAGRPTAALISVGLPRQGGRTLAEELFLGVREMAAAFDTAIVGGDTNSWRGPLAISITLLGEATPKGPVLRSGAKPGDWLFVTGPLGGSILGKHLTFTPRIQEALRLHALVDLHAMIDISDGLAADLHHLCDESACGAELDASAIPVSDAARQMADTRSPLDHALGDGEDFELLFAVDPSAGRELLSSQPLPGLTLAHIGRCVEQGVWLQREGQREILAPLGYVHALEGMKDEG